MQCQYDNLQAGQFAEPCKRAADNAGDVVRVQIPVIDGQ